MCTLAEFYRNFYSIPKVSTLSQEIDFLIRKGIPEKEIMKSVKEKMGLFVLGCVYVHLSDQTIAELQQYPSALMFNSFWYVPWQHQVFLQAIPRHLRTLAENQNSARPSEKMEKGNFIGFLASLIISLYFIFVWDTQIVFYHLLSVNVSLLRFKRRK